MVQGVGEIKNLAQPPAVQLVVPDGVPLQPVETMRSCMTMTHPTLLFMQFALLETVSAIDM